jgi:hypothetical protein
MLNHITVAQETPLRVFILAGQSNMLGVEARISKLPKELRGEQRHALFFNGERWITLAPGKTEEKGFGPEISFAEKLSMELRDSFGIIKHSSGGASLSQDWTATVLQSHYFKLLKKVTAAKKTCKMEVIGMLWMQGESDSANQNMAGAYSKNLSEFIQAVREDVESPGMFFVAGRVNPPKDRFPFVDIVRKAQEECKVPGYTFVDCDSIEKIRGRLHYTTRGLVDLGYRFADAALKQIRNK